MNMEEVLNRITGYKSVLTKHNYVESGAGIKPWSIRWLKGELAIEIQGSGWTAYPEMITGVDPESLNQYLGGAL